MPLSNNSIGSSSSAGSVLGAATALAAGSQILPRTGMGSWVIYLVIASLAASALVLLSFAATRIARLAIKK